jgi:transcription initiation factor TFIIB
MSKTSVTPSNIPDIRPTPLGSAPTKAKCHECGSIFLYHDFNRGEVVCTKCGLVLESKMIKYSEDLKPCITFEDKMKISHNGGPIGGSRIKDQISKTTIKSRDCRGNPYFRRLMKIEAGKQADLRSLSISLMHLKRISSELSLPSYVQDDASEIFNKAWKMGVLRGYSIELVVSASVYYACRKNKIARTTSEIAKCSSLDPVRVSRLFSKLFKILSISIPRIDYSAFAEKYAKILKVDPIHTAKIIKATKILKTTTFLGKNPLSFIGALIYIIPRLDGKKYSQKQIASLLNITEVTIRKRINDLKPFYPQILNR